MTHEENEMVEETHEGLRLREIPGEPGFYAREDGTIWSRWICRGHKKDWQLGRELYQVHTSSTKKSPYLRANLYSGQRVVHTVMLETFIGPRPEGHEARHFPRQNAYDNALDNLSWTMRLVNMRDKVANGTAPIGVDNPNAKFTLEEIAEIREAYIGGEHQYILAERYAVSQAAISFLLRGVTYGGLGALAEKDKRHSNPRRMDSRNVENVFALSAEGLSNTEIARIYERSKSSIGQILHGFRRIDL